MGEGFNIRKEIIGKIKELGRVMDDNLTDAMIRLYAPLLNRAPREGVSLTRDESYGPHNRHRLDIYFPDKKSSESIPVLVFFHGGGFTEGDKDLYRNIGYYFARHGITTLIPSYRLAPEHKWPSGAEDVAKVLKWIKANGSKLNGGNAKGIFLMGHSAGASHVSTYIFFEDLQLKENDNVLGTILMSGPSYDTNNMTELTFPYYGKDRSRYADMSVINRIEGCKVPVFIIFADFDPPGFEFQSITLIKALYDRDNSSPYIKRIINHNHISEVLQFNTGDHSIGPDIIDFINGIRGW